DLGCGEGDFSCYLASLGAAVTALDIFEMNINITRLRAERKLLPKVKTKEGSCIDTGVPDGSFDVIVGEAIIHHLTVEEELLLYPEVLRLLNANGVAIFMESLHNSPAIEFLRTLVPVLQKHDPRPSRLSKSWNEYVSNDPHPSRPNTTKHYRNVFGNFNFKRVELEEVGILSRLDRITTNRKLCRWIHDFDYKVKKFIPFNSKLSRNIIITLYK